MNFVQIFSHLFEAVVKQYSQVWFLKSQTSDKTFQTESSFIMVDYNITCTLFALQVLHKLLSWNTLGNMQTSQEHFKTIIYAKFGGQTECIMGNWKIENYTEMLGCLVKLLLREFSCWLCSPPVYALQATITAIRSNHPTPKENLRKL